MTVAERKEMDEMKGEQESNENILVAKQYSFARQMMNGLGAEIEQVVKKQGEPQIKPRFKDKLIIFFRKLWYRD